MTILQVTNIILKIIYILTTNVSEDNNFNCYVVLSYSGSN